MTDSTDGVELRSLGRTATFLRARFACTEDEVLRAVQRLLPTQVDPGIDPAWAGAVCDALQSRLSLSEPELRALMLKLPPVLGYSYEYKIEPSLAALQSRLCLSEPELKTVVLALPPVLNCSFETNMEPSLATLQFQFSVLGHTGFPADMAPTLEAVQTRLAPSASLWTNPWDRSNSTSKHMGSLVAIACLLTAIRLARDKLLVALSYFTATAQ